MKSSRQKLPVAPRNQIYRAKCDSKEPVQVFCRMRPMLHASDVSCMKVASSTKVIITPPESAINFRNVSKVIQTLFSRVFDDKASQRDAFTAVALPLIVNLINGENSLLFTYGVTGSGKTYTMTGDAHNPGIMPRCLNVLFNSIANYQAQKYTFKPDKLNGFDIQSEEDAAQDRQNELHSTLMTPYNGRTKLGNWRLESETDSNSVPIYRTNSTENLQIDEDNVYAVFVTYIEIYNNSVYDLLEDDEIKTKILQSKIIREDGNRNMYVHAVNEIEVKSSEEALELFQRGQRRRRIAHTALNAESSRSHSVFTIRLVQAPLDCQGEQAVQDKRAICVSQLSLVDLAGTERTNRSKNTGQRLREAGNINNSLMTLRTCLEILRENQIQGTNRIVPYRDSKLTHLFKNYFDGEGQIRMIVCVNPRAEDYDETIQAMKFAEMTQEVQVARSMATKLDLGYTPGRRQANKIFKEARSRLERAGNMDAAELDIDVGLVYSLGGPFPEMELTNPCNDQIITNLMRFLELRIQKRNVLREHLQQTENNFRNMLVKLERENVSFKIENVSLKASNEQQKKKISALENHICKTETQIDTLLYRLNSANDAIRNLQQELKDKDMSLNQRIIDKQKVKQKYNTKIQIETEKLNKELEIKLRQQREKLQGKMKEKEDKLKLMKQILTSGNGTDGDDVSPMGSASLTNNNTPTVSSERTELSAANVPSAENNMARLEAPESYRASRLEDHESYRAARLEDHESYRAIRLEDHVSYRAVRLEDPESYGTNTRDRIPVVNPRYRRSQSADRWLDHRPTPLVPVGTILQPLMHRRKSVSQLTDPTDVTSKVSRYCLVSQEQDDDGELETKLYKGDILPTSGGGAQVVFNDVEYLKQLSPVTTRKRSGPPTTPRSKAQIPPQDCCSSTTETNSKRLRV